MKKSLFLLGGHDLEMETVKNMLLIHGEFLADGDLRWNNARLSSYARSLSTSEQWDKIYGIELQENVVPPPNYQSIDHHNERSCQLSSLEQVAQILGTELSWWERLVAANDSGYIPAMLALGATKEEVSAVRAADRRAQHITEEDERLAEKAIAEQREIMGDLQIVKAFNAHFSPITDRLFPFRKLLIYTDNELTYYGENRNRLFPLFTNKIRQGNAYYGGTENGYFGFAREKNSHEKMTGYVEQIKKIVK